MKRLTRAQVREVDRRAIEEFGVHSLVLMENAGRGCVEVLERQGVAGPVLICCGKGNNGGDGFVVARHLDNRGHTVRVVHWDPPESFAPDCRANYEIVARSGIPLVHADSGQPETWNDLARDAAWCVDALLGTGSRGEPRPPYDAVITWLNRLPAHRLAIDLPSGLDCDTGVPARATIRADHTCTFVAEKAGFAAASAQPFLGCCHVIDIGAPRKILST